MAFEDGSLVKYYLPPDNRAEPFIDEDWFGFTDDEDIDAFDILDNGNIILSTDTDAEISGLSFRDGDLIEIEFDFVNRVVNSATLFFSEDLFDDDENVNAVDFLTNGHIILSTTSSAKLGGCLLGPGDLADYNPITDEASLLLDENEHFGSIWPVPSANTDAVSILANGHIILSTGYDVPIGGITCRSGDLVDYDPDNKIASLLVSEDRFVKHYEPPFINIDAVYIPEPTTVLLLGLGSLALLRRCLV